MSCQSTLSNSLSGPSLSVMLCESKWTLLGVLLFLKLWHLYACTILVVSGLCCLSVSLCWITEQGSLRDFFLIGDSSNCNRRWIHSFKDSLEVFDSLKTPQIPTLFVCLFWKATERWNVNMFPKYCFILCSYPYFDFVILYNHLVTWSQAWGFDTNLTTFEQVL